MAILKNPKHEAFAQARARGLSIDRAYEEAGYKPNRGNAARMNTNEGVTARIAELQAETRAEHGVTVATIDEQLREDRALARALEQPKAALDATVARAKLHGLWVDRSENNVNLKRSAEDFSDAELSAFLSGRGE